MTLHKFYKRTNQKEKKSLGNWPLAFQNEPRQIVANCKLSEEIGLTRSWLQRKKSFNHRFQFLAPFVETKNNPGLYTFRVSMSRTTDKLDHQIIFLKNVSKNKSNTQTNNRPLQQGLPEMRFPRNERTTVNKETYFFIHTPLFKSTLVSGVTLSIYLKVSLTLLSFKVSFERSTRIWVLMTKMSFHYQGSREKQTFYNTADNTLHLLITEILKNKALSTPEKVKCVLLYIN